MVFDKVVNIGGGDFDRRFGVYVFDAAHQGVEVIHQPAPLHHQAEQFSGL